MVGPALSAFKPELIIVPSGLDANALDPLARMMVHSEWFRNMTRVLMDVADDVCEGRIVMCHEGGYSTAYVPFCGLAGSEELSGISNGVEDPYLENFASLGGQELQPHQEEAIATAEPNVGRLAAV